MEENDEEEKEPINIELTEHKTDPYNDENTIDFKLSNVKEEDLEDIALANFIENCKSKLMRKFPKKVTRWSRNRTEWKEKLRRSFFK